MKATGTRPLRKRDIRATRKQMTWLEEQSLRVEPQARARTTDGRGNSDGVRRAQGVASEDLAHEGSTVRVLTRASTVRARLAYPADGHHTFTPTNSERRALRQAMRAAHRRGDAEAATPPAFVRAAALRAAGAPVEPRARTGLPSAFVPASINFHLTRAERAALDAAMGDRDFGAWMRDAVRAAAGMGQHPWSPCADAVLTKGFRRRGLDELLRALPGRDAGKLYDRAGRLGLSREITDDRLTLKDAEAVSGYSNTGLMQVLAAGGVVIHTLVGPKAHAAFRRRFVLRTDLERAVKAYGETELLSEACARLGRPPETMTRALARLGHTKPRGKGRWRLPSKVFDAAEAAIRGEGTTLKAAAASVGVSTVAMRAWLTAAGVIRADAHYHRLDAAAVARVVEAKRAQPCRGCGLAGHFGDLRKCREAQASAETESFHEAAKRTGVHYRALRRALADLGHTKPAGARCWRLPPETFDAAAVTHRERVGSHDA